MTGDAVSALGSALGLEFTRTPIEHDVAGYTILTKGSDRGLLLPMGNRRAAAAGVLRISNGQSQFKKMAVVAAWLGLRTGVFQRLSGRQREPLYIAESPASPGPNLLDHLGEIVGREDLNFAMSVGPPRPNRKPVIQIVAPSGATLGFAKLGWNELTTRLVRQEAEYLQAMPRAAGSRVRAPELLHHGPWKDLTLNILSTMRPGLQAAFRSPVPGASVLFEIASLGDGRRRQNLGDSDLAKGTLDRAEAIDHESQAIALESAHRLISRHGDLELELGDWHGDFGPWNIAAAGAGRFNVWDWERASGPQLVGMDLYHYHFQQENFAGSTIQACIERSSQRTAAAMTEIQGKAFPHELAGRLYLLERLLRYREPGAPDEVSPLEAAITDQLRSID